MHIPRRSTATAEPADISAVLIAFAFSALAMIPFLWMLCGDAGSAWSEVSTPPRIVPAPGGSFPFAGGQ